MHPRAQLDEQLHGARREGQRSEVGARGWVVTVALLIEMVIIVGQAAVGHRSHYNVDTAPDAVLWDTMGASIVALWLATLAVGLRFLRDAGPDRITATAIRLGLAVTLVGLAEGFLMATPGAHTVGLPDDGPGLPFLGWSTTGGDLRIAHFVDMHALRGLPLLAAALSVVPRLDDATRVRVLRTAAAAWTGVVVLLTWQALRAQPLLAPDTTTLAALAALVAGVGAALVATVVAARRPTDLAAASAYAPDAGPALR